jgi:hypothetical protein
MSDDFASSRHQSPASSAVYGRLDTSRNGRAPRSASRRTYVSTFARYTAFVSDQGVVVEAPKSSFSAIRGLSHADDCAAVSNSLSAEPTIVSAAAGLDGVPTRRRQLRSK